MIDPTEAPMANAIDDVKEWVLVPKEPTEAMYEAGYDATRRPDGFPQFADAGFVLGHSGAIYSAMLAAAPPSPAPSQHTGGSDEAAVQRLKAAYIAETGSTMWPTDEQFRRILAASSIAPETGFEVKALSDWKHIPSLGVWSIGTPLGVSYWAWERDGRGFWCRFEHSNERMEVEGGLTGAQAACFADLNTRIRSAISPSVAKESGEP